MMMMKSRRFTAQELLQALTETGHVALEGWSIHLTDDWIWLTNPYGIDCGFYRPDVPGCARVLEHVAADDHEKEWGAL